MKIKKPHISEQEYKNWLDLCLRIRNATAVSYDDQSETAEQRQARIKDLLRPANFEKFCQYYFPHYIDAPFGWFHKKAAREILTREDIMAALEWPREHAKSVLIDVLVPMYLKATGWLTGMLLASENEHKAAVLLGDLQAELLENQRFIADFGEQRTIGKWSEGFFSTSDGVGFWSFGLGQNPAGVRQAAKRPNYGVVDDAANRRRSQNQDRIKADADWVLGDFMGCLAIKASKLIFANNRTCSDDLMAHLVGDVNEGDPVRENLVHIKVFATEDPKTHKMLLIEHGGAPAWKERYTLDVLKKRMQKMGYRNAMRNFYHQDIKDGNVFLEEHLPWVDCLALDKYDALVSYCDPSYKDAKKNDTKAIALIGKTGLQYHILWAWVRHASRKAMVRAHYLVGDIIKGKQQHPAIKWGKQESSCAHYIEASFIQEDLFKQEYITQGVDRAEQLRIRADKRAKPDKFGRIEDLSPIAESGCLGFNRKLQKDPDMKTLRDQFLAFPNGHDDGPDCVEGGIHLLNKKHRSHGRTRQYRTGKYKRPVERTG